MRSQAQFVSRMEDVLDQYALPFNPKRPLVCLDETTKQLVRQTRRPIRVGPGRPAYEDYEYERNGVGTLFMVCCPLLGWRRVIVSERKTRNDYAHVLRSLAEDHFPDVEKIVLVQDNLNTHEQASLYNAFEPELARELSQRFELHYTPTHASWLNIAECELSALTRQCLNRRIADINELRKQVEAWQIRRNDAKVRIDWQFTTDDARVKLKHLYPSIHPC